MGKNNKKNREEKKTKKLKKLTSEKNRIGTIYLDESGNTGHNLIDDEQLVFTLCGCNYSDKQAKKLIDVVNSKSPTEVHFKNLKRRKSGQDGIIRLMSNSLISKKHVKVELINKNYMVITKIVDILIETMSKLSNIDLKKNGLNISLSNMQYYLLPEYCGEERFQFMLKQFVLMIKKQTKEAIESYYNSVLELKTNCTDNDVEVLVDLILVTKYIVDKELVKFDKSELDPCIPAFMCLCSIWNGFYKNGFHIVHDDSKSINEQKKMFAKFMDLNQESTLIGYDRRKFTLPIKGRSLKFANSKESLQIQVADIIASSIAYWANGVLKKSNDYLFLELNKLNLARLLIKDTVWPSQFITPSELNTEFDGGLDAVRYATRILQKA